MVNELVFVDGQESFIDLVIPLRGEVESSNDAIQWWSRETFAEIPMHISRNFPEQVRHRLLSLRISMNHLREYYVKAYYNYSVPIQKVQEALWRCTKLFGRRRLTATLRKLMLLEKNAESIMLDYKIIGSVVSLLPTRYLTYDKQVLEWQFDNLKWRINLYLLKIQVQAIAYLEQQSDLGRVNLSKQTKAMLVAMRDCMAVHEEGQDFDTYINKWSDKILTEMGLKQELDFRKKRAKELVNACHVRKRIERNMRKYGTPYAQRSKLPPDEARLRRNAYYRNRYKRRMQNPEYVAKQKERSKRRYRFKQSEQTWKESNTSSSSQSCA